MDAYEIISKLGCGSYGQALQAKEKLGNRNCVIKEIKVSHLNLKDLESAKKEVKVLSSLLHSHITKFFDSFESNDCIYIVMEYCGGGDLQKLIDSRNGVHFPENRILDWFTQLCLAVRFIHQRHIIHRDIKAQNVFLTDEGRIKLGDFGIAKILDRTSDLTNTCIGTPFYLSPEMCENKPYSNKSDIWAVGCVLYEMAVLKHAFDACNMKSLVIKIIKCSYPPLPPRYSRDLKLIVQQIFQRYPKCRPSVNSILTKTVVSKRLSRFITEEEAMELQARKVLTTKNNSTLTKRNALRSRIGISSPAAKYVTTPKMNISYPNVTCSSKAVYSPKVNLHSESFLGVYKNPFQAVVKKKVNKCSPNNISFEDPAVNLSKNKMKQIPLKKRCYSHSPKLMGKTKNCLSSAHENKSYIDKSLHHSKSDRQSKLNLIINESSDSFKKIDVSSSILSNIDKLECSLGRTGLQYSSGWLLDFYLSKRLINLKNDLKSSGHLSDTAKFSDTPLSEILSDIQQHKYYSPVMPTDANISKHTMQDNVNFIVKGEIEKARLMAESRRKLAYDEEKHALESTFKSTDSILTNDKISESDLICKDIKKAATFGNEICRNWKKSGVCNVHAAESNSQLKFNSTLSNSTSFTKENSNLELQSVKSHCDGSFFDILNIVNSELEEVPSFEGAFQQNRKHWSNGPNDIVNILSSAKLLDGRNSMVCSERHTLTKSDIVVTDPISFSNEQSDTIYDKNKGTNCINDVKKNLMGKTYSISNHLSSNENLHDDSITAKPICMDQNVEEMKSINLEKHLDNEIHVEERIDKKIETPLVPDKNKLTVDKNSSVVCKNIVEDNGELTNLSSDCIRNFEVNYKSVKATSNFIPSQNMDVSLENLSELELMQCDIKNDSECLEKNKSTFLGMHNEGGNQKLNLFNINNREPDQTLSIKKTKKKLFSFLHSRCTSVPDESLHKAESGNSYVKHFGSPRSKARFSAVLRKFLLRESLEKSGNTFNPVNKNLKKKLDSEEFVEQPLFLEVNSEDLEQPLSLEVNPEIVKQPLSLEINSERVEQPLSLEVNPKIVEQHLSLEVNPEAVEQPLSLEVNRQVVEQPLFLEVNREVVEQPLSLEVNREVVEQPFSLRVNREIVSCVAKVDSENQVQSSEAFLSEHPLIQVNDIVAAKNDCLWTDVKMDITKDSGVNSSLLYSTLDTLTNSSSLDKFLIDNSNLRSWQNETVSDVGCDTITTCSPIPIDIKYISGLEITLGNDSIINATVKPIVRQDVNDESSKNLHLYSPICSHNFENTFKPINNKEHNSNTNNVVYIPNCSNIILTNEDSLRKTAFTIVEDAFRGAIKKLEEKHFTSRNSVDENSFCSEFKPCNTTTHELKNNDNHYYKFDHHKNVNFHSIDASSKYIDKIPTWSIDVENKRSNTAIIDLGEIISTQSTPVAKKVCSQILGLENCSKDKPSPILMTNSVINCDNKFSKGERNVKTVLRQQNDNFQCKTMNSTISESDVDDYSYSLRNSKDVTIRASNSVQMLNDDGPIFVKGNWIKIPSLQSSMSDDAQDVTNFRQSLENLLFSGDEEVFEKETLQMSVCSDALEIDIVDGDVHGWIEELRAKLEEVLGLEMFLEAYRCLECAFELNNSHLKEALCHVKKIIGPNHEQMANDILQLIVTESVHLN